MSTAPFKKVFLSRWTSTKHYPELCSPIASIRLAFLIPQVNSWMGRRNQPRESSLLVSASVENVPPSVCEGENLTQAVRLEQLWALIAHTCVVDLLCGYPTALFERHNKGVEHIREVHSAGLPCKLLGVFVDYTPRFVLCESGFS